MIPKIIHYCWFGSGELPEDVQKHINTWKEKCPEYRIIEWNESNFDVKKNQYCFEAYNKKKWAFVSDYVRLNILYKYGGIYMDTDVEVVRKFDNLLRYSAFFGFQNDEEVSIGTIGACANNEFVSRCLQKYTNKSFVDKFGNMDLTPNIELVTDLLVSDFNLEKNGQMQQIGDSMIVLPMNYLVAKSFETGVIMKDSHTYAIHHFGGTWLPEEQRNYLKLCQKNYAVFSKMFPATFSLMISKCLAAYKIGGVIHVVKKINKKILK